MTERIAVGDLVQIVKARSCCPEKTGWGFIFRVATITDSSGEWSCPHCGVVSKKEPTAWLDRSANIGGELYRLKRIPPLSELEGQRTEENLKEPA